MNQNDLAGFVKMIQDRNLEGIKQIENDFAKFTRWSVVAKIGQRIDVSKRNEPDYFDRLGRVVFKTLWDRFWAELDRSLAQLYELLPDNMKLLIEKEHLRVEKEKTLYKQLEEQRAVANIANLKAQEKAKAEIAAKEKASRDKRQNQPKGTPEERKAAKTLRARLEAEAKAERIAEQIKRSFGEEPEAEPTEYKAPTEPDKGEFADLV
ncbi:MAG: hypothetical protein WC477_07415 [Patescibacteria group bacterium]